MTTVGVCGFGRCGSTMVMAMLHAGGVPPVDGAMSGSYEVPAMIGAQAADVLAGLDLAGRSVKLLDMARDVRLPSAEWRFVWLDRDADEQAKSSVKFLGWQGFPSPPGRARRMARGFRADRDWMLTVYRQYGSVVPMRYEKMLHDPAAAAAVLAAGLGLSDFDVAAAAGVVHRRDGRCAVDVRVEEAVEAFDA